MEYDIWAQEMDTKIEIKEEPWWSDTTSAPHINSDETPSSEIAFLNSGVNLKSDIGTDEMDTKIDLKEEPLYLKRMQMKSESDVDLKSNISVTDDREEEHQLTDPTRLCTEGDSCDEREANTSNVTHVNRNNSVTQISDLQNHRLGNRDGKGPHICNICGKILSTVGCLKRHNLSHDGKRPYKCKICGKTFSTSGCLKRHNSSHDGKRPHACTICGKTFIRAYTLKIHYLSHEGKKPHKCEVCEKSFFTAPDLKKHRLYHEDEKQHKCKVCQKSFFTPSHLKRHNLSHWVKGK